MLSVFVVSVGLYFTLSNTTPFTIKTINVITPLPYFTFGQNPVVAVLLFPFFYSDGHFMATFKVVFDILMFTLIRPKIKLSKYFCRHL